MVGLIVFGLNFVFGWPAVSLCGFLAIYLEEPLIFVLGAPAIYSFSWLLWLAGALVRYL